VSRYYDEYLRQFYRARRGCESLPYQAQLETLCSDFFGWPAQLVRHMKIRAGIDARIVICNAQSLQRAWAREHSLTISDSGWQEEICLEQIRLFRPDVLWLDPPELFGPFARTVRPLVGKIITWIGSPFSRDLDTSGISVLITENPRTLQEKRHAFERVIVTTPGFDYPAILDRVGAVEKRYALTFVGGISPHHLRRAELLSWLVEQGVDLTVFGYIQEAPDQPRYQRCLDILRPAHRGAVYGVDYYRTLAESCATLNIHIDCAGDNAGNMRLFEAAGMGACTITEQARNLADLFNPGEEVLAYGFREELLATVRQLAADESLCRSIAEAGRQRAWRQHTPGRMLESIRPAFGGI